MVCGCRQEPVRLRPAQRPQLSDRLAQGAQAGSGGPPRPPRAPWHGAGRHAAARLLPPLPPLPAAGGGLCPCLLDSAAPAAPQAARPPGCACVCRLRRQRLAAAGSGWQVAKVVTVVTACGSGVTEQRLHVLRLLADTRSRQSQWAEPAGRAWGTTRTAAPAGAWPLSRPCAPRRGVHG